MRTLIFWPLVIVHTLIFSILSILCGLFDRWGRATDLVSRGWSGGILKFGGAKVHVEGIDKVDLSQPRIYVSNHQSYFDVFALMAYLPGNARFVAKKSLEYIPIFGFAMRAIGTVIIDKRHPEKAREALTRGAGKQLGGSKGVIIFPEGTRSRDGVPGEFKLGAFMLAIQSGVHIVPVAVSGTKDILPARSLWVRPGVIHVCIGDAISVKGLTPDDRYSLMERTKRQVETMLGKSGGVSRNLHKAA